MQKKYLEIFKKKNLLSLTNKAVSIKKQNVLSGFHKLLTSLGNFQTNFSTLYPCLRRFQRKANIRNEIEEKVITIESWSAAVAGDQTQVQVLRSDREVE